MKKKTVNITSPASLEKEQYKAFVERLKVACDRMAGNGFFAQLPQEYLPKLYEQRLPPLKLDFTRGDLDANDQAYFQNEFKLRINGIAFPTLPGEKISLGDFFRDGILLISFFRRLAEIKPHPEILPVLIGAYQVGSEWFLKASEAAMKFINTICIVKTDPTKRVLVVDYSTTTLLGGALPDNKIRLRFIKVMPLRVKLEGYFRDVFPLGWTNSTGKKVDVIVNAAEAGYSAISNSRVPVFIQQHALNRLKERLSLSSGMLAYMLDCLFSSRLESVFFNNTPMIALNAGGKKLGYLVTELNENKLIIITFLFLTNDGTPEGKKLAELTRLQKHDKKHWSIDTLEGVNSLSVSEDPTLTQIFTEAGCTDLLDLKVFNNFAYQHNKGVTPDMLLHYLQDSPFMRRR